MPTVLVVDDSAVDRRVVGGWVEKHLDLTVVYASDGKEALDQITRHWPDLVITDLIMQEMDGLQLVSIIKLDYPRIPVILLTARGSEEIAAEALRKGAASYVPKKFLTQYLSPTIERVLGGAEEDRAHSHLMHHLSQGVLTFAFYNDLGLIRSLVSHIQQMLRCLPLGDEIERLRVGIAFEEALKNAYFHGNLEVGGTVGEVDQQKYAELAAERGLQSPYCERRIHVEADISREAAVLTVCDEGPGFNTTELPETVDLEDQDRPAGRGIPLMLSIMDEVNYNLTGNKVTLIKRRAPEQM